MEYKRTLTQDEVKILHHDLLDIKDWINKAIDGKISNCLKRAAKDYRESKKNDPQALVPVNDMTCAMELFNQADYKNRSQRENDSIQARQ